LEKFGLFPLFFYIGGIFITKEYIMKKIVRLTERDLTRIVKRVIKENNVPENNVPENSCEDFISRMRDIYEETQSFISRKSDKIRKSDEFRKSGGIYVYTVYEILEDQLGYIVDMAEEMECDNYYDLLEMYEEYTETIAEILELDKTKLLNL
jgi:hypothetical protein